MTDIFISYSSKNKDIADIVCSTLEEANLQCWIAPRDISPGEQYAAGIVRGIDNAKCMVLIFSEAANKSQHVLREIERCVGNNTIIIPFKIDTEMPSDAMDYFLKVAHWIDIQHSDLESEIEKLKITVAKILEKPVPQKVVNNKPAKTKKLPVWMLAASICFVAIATAAWFFIPDDNQQASTEQNTRSVIDNDAKLPDEAQLTEKKEQEIGVLSQYIKDNNSDLEEVSKVNIESVQRLSDALPNNKVNVKAWSSPDKPVMFEDETVSFKVILDTDAYILTYVHSIDGNTYLIYPNQFATPRKVEKDTVFNIGEKDPFKLVVQEPFGVDLVHVIATNDIDEYLALLNSHKAITTMDISTITREDLLEKVQVFGKRGIGVVANEPSSSEANSQFAWGDAVVFLNTKAK